MSNSLAKKRRANLPIPPSQVTSSPVSNQNTQDTSGERRPLTLPQVLSILDRRLNALEKDNTTRQVVEETMVSTPAVNDSIKEILDEYESRFDMLAEQINFMKDTILKLQTFTMEVNKKILDERDQIIRDQNDSMHLSGLNFQIKDTEIIEDEEDDE